MAAPSRAFFLWERSRLSDVLSSAVTPRFEHAKFAASEY
jgi:hypothetical protein